MPAKSKLKGSYVLCDLSQMYFAIRELKVRADYKAIVEDLSEGTPFTSVIGFTAVDKTNEAQKRMLDLLESEGWSIDRRSNRHAKIVDNESLPVTVLLRFDADIAFSLARLAGHAKRVVVISNSFSLQASMLETIRRGTDVELAWYAENLDPRWFSLISDEKLGYIDLTSQMDKDPGLGNFLSCLP